MSTGEGWELDPDHIMSPANLERARRIVEDEGSLVVEHSYYAGGGSPTQHIFTTMDDFLDHLKGARAGDIIQLWSFEKVCTKENLAISAKFPDDQGRTPRRGPY